MLYPTRYEGFGLPAIEAMALRVPLVTGDCTSLPEVVGDAGMLVPPDDQAGFTDALDRVLTDTTLRSALISKGAARLPLFQPARMGERMVEVFREMLGA